MLDRQLIAVPFKAMPHDKVANDGAFDYRCNAESEIEAWRIFSIRYLKENPHRSSLTDDCCVCMMNQPVRQW